VVFVSHDGAHGDAGHIARVDAQAVGEHVWCDGFAAERDCEEGRLLSETSMRGQMGVFWLSRRVACVQRLNFKVRVRMDLLESDGLNLADSFRKLSSRGICS